jgi:hypothetical protein
MAPTISDRCGIRSMIIGESADYIKRTDPDHGAESTAPELLRNDLNDPTLGVGRPIFHDRVN